MTLPASFFALEARLVALGRRQRVMHNSQSRLGEFCRQRELEGERPARVLANYRKWQHRVNKAIDPYMIRSGT